jgi:hypothetical protein
MDEPIACSQCGAPARITQRFWLASTDGPVEHLVIGCGNLHWLTPRAETPAGVQSSSSIPAADLFWSLVGSSYQRKLMHTS